MSENAFAIRPAGLEDAGFMAPMIDQAGEGIPRYFWTQMAAPGQSPLDVGISRVRREDTGVSWRNGWIAEVDGRATGCLIAYSQPDKPEPIDPETSALMRPLNELEHQAPGTGYVYVISTLPEFRGKGVGTRLLTFAERYRGPNGMSLIVADNNAGARRLYERCGYREQARRRMVKNGWQSPGTDWVLMTKR